MENKKSKFAQIAFKRSYQGKFGLMYVYDCVMDNGDWGEVQTKTQDKYKIGEELSYTMESRMFNNQEFWSLKPVKENPGGFGKSDPNRDASIIRQSTMKMTIDLICSNKIGLNEFEKWQTYFETYAKNLK